MNRRPLTPEEQEEAKRLAFYWGIYKENHPRATQSWLAEASGLGTQGAVSQYLRGAIPLNLGALLALCRAMDVDPDEISPRLMASVYGHRVIDVRSDAIEQRYLRAANEPPQPAASKLLVGVADTTDSQFTFVRKLRLVLKAGVPGFFVEDPEADPMTAAVPTSWLTEKGYASSSLIAIDAQGESMEPTLYSGDVVVVNTADTRPIDGGVYAINYEGELLIKRLSRDAGEWWLMSDNPDQRKYHRKVFSDEACIIVGRVVRRETDRF